MMVLFTNICNARKLKLDTYADISVIETACFQLHERHCRLSRHERNYAGSSDALLTLVEFHAKLVWVWIPT